MTEGSLFLLFDWKNKEAIPKKTEQPVLKRSERSCWYHLCAHYKSHARDHAYAHAVTART